MQAGQEWDFAAQFTRKAAAAKKLLLKYVVTFFREPFLFLLDSKDPFRVLLSVLSKKLLGISRGSLVGVSVEVSAAYTRSEHSDSRPSSYLTFSMAEKSSRISSTIIQSPPLSTQSTIALAKDRYHVLSHREKYP